jgi:hypothetical protein
MIGQQCENDDCAAEIALLSLRPLISVALAESEEKPLKWVRLIFYRIIKNEGPQPA